MSSTARVIIVGGLGQLGEALVGTAAECGCAPETVRQCSRAEIDLLDGTRVAEMLSGLAPQTVINCAVFQPVDLCESEPAKAFAVNAIGAGALARACRDVGARLVHVSTDYVFGGARRKPYTEDDLPAPRNLYGASKLAGEHLVVAASEMNMVVRTSGVFGKARAGHGTAPFIQRMVERAMAARPTQVVADQWISPTNARDLARGIWRLLECGGTGTFHVAGAGAATWFELACVAFEAAGARQLLRPTTAAEYGAAAPRADYTALECARLRQLGLLELPAWRDGVRRYLGRYYPSLG